MSSVQKGIGHQQSKVAFDEQRREFLRKSVRLAYTARILTTILVEKASAGSSSGSGAKNPNCNDPNWAADHPGVCGPF